LTLVVHVPFKNGSAIVSDRQNTYSEDFTREPIDKIIPLPEFRAAVGFSGPTQKCRYLIGQLRRFQVNAPFEDAYRETYQKCYGQPELGFREQDVEFLVVACRPPDKRPLVHRILGAVINEVDSGKCAAIGGGAKYVLPQLQLNTLEISQEQAEEFGSTLLAYASKIDITVGDPATYGYNAVVVTDKLGAILLRNPNIVDIKRLLYDFG
jgi:20S proteasome alpha/beta subunit